MVLVIPRLSFPTSWDERPVLGCTRLSDTALLGCIQALPGTQNLTPSAKLNLFLPHPLASHADSLLPAGAWEAFGSQQGPHPALQPHVGLSSSSTSAFLPSEHPSSWDYIFPSPLLCGPELSAKETACLPSPATLWLAPLHLSSASHSLGRCGCLSCLRQRSTQAIVW